MPRPKNEEIAKVLSVRIPENLYLRLKRFVKEFKKANPAYSMSLGGAIRLSIKELVDRPPKLLALAGKDPES
jgi:hypothetical protein